MRETLLQPRSANCSATEKHSAVVSSPSLALPPEEPQYLQENCMLM